MRVGLRAFSLFLALVFALAFACCAPVKNSHSTFLAMDTVMDLTVYGDAGVLESAEELIRSLEGELSVTDENSAVARLNATGRAELSPETAALIRTALALGEKTGGALDITLYPVVRAWGFTTGEYRVPSDSELASLLELTGISRVETGGCTVTLPDGMMLDLGAVAKGYAADRLSALLCERGVKSAVFNLGGNVLAYGHKPNGEDWRIGINDPLGEGNACIIRCHDRAIVTSGGYQRFFEQDGTRYCHIIDPSTGYPVNNGLASVTVISENGTEADALSTALYVMGYERAVEFWRENGGFEAVFITIDGALTVTEGLESACSPAGNYSEFSVAKR